MRKGRRAAGCSRFSPAGPAQKLPFLRPESFVPSPFLHQEHASELYDLIVNREGYIFVCGDGMNMAKDVQVGRQ